MNGHHVIMFFHRISLKLRPTLKTESEIVLLAERKVLLTLTFQRRTSKETFVPQITIHTVKLFKTLHIFKFITLNQKIREVEHFHQIFWIYD